MRNFLLCLVALCAIVVSSCESATNTTLEPKLEITSNTTLRVEKGGGIFAIEYSVANPVEGQSVEVKVVNSEMITAVNSDTFGLVKISVSENLSTDMREGAVIINYGSQSATVVVLQEENLEGGDSVERIDITATHLIGTYYGENLTQGLAHYWIIVSDGGFKDGEVVPNSEFFRFDILAPLQPDTEDITIPDGTYSFDSYNSFSAYTIINLGNSDYMWVDNELEGWVTPFDDAEFTVNGSSLALVARVGSKEYHVNYSGEYSITESTISETISNLTEDVVIDVSDCEVSLNNYGDYWGCGYCNWGIEFVSKNGTNNGVYLVLDLLATTADAASGFTGVYHSSGFSEEDPTKPDFGPGVFIPGMRISDDGVHLLGSLYQKKENGRGVHQAPIYDGTITISDNGDGTHRIVIDAVDDATPAHRITLDWTGIL